MALISVPTFCAAFCTAALSYNLSITSVVFARAKDFSEKSSLLTR
jgi:hypothetical protein